MTCGGFDKSLLGGCGIAWGGLVILFFVGALLNKWGGQEVDIPFNFITSVVVGFLAYIILVTVTGQPRWGLLAGVIGLVASGYATPYMYEEPTFG